jgi:hypothetical protein
MNEMSIFPDKESKPTENDVAEILADKYSLWKQIHDLVLEKYPDGVKEWNYPGKKYGWSYRIKDKKRAIIYFLPQDKSFKVAFVFGQKAYDVIMGSSISEHIKTDLSNAKKYAEGRGVRIEVRDKSNLPDIKQLIEIKLAN